MKKQQQMKLLNQLINEFKHVYEFLRNVFLFFQKKKKEKKKTKNLRSKKMNK